MKHYLKKGELVTTKTTCIYNITEIVKKYIEESKIKNGHIIIQPLHTTASIFLNEKEKRLIKDLINHLIKQVPKSAKYLHDDIEKRNCPPDEPLNCHSHIKATLYSNPSLSLILYKGKLQLGKYQKILFAEFDGPCPRKHKQKRQYLVSVMGE